MENEAKHNEAWTELCNLTTTLAPQHGGSRRDAFEAACAQRPDLAAEAVNPSGEPVIPRAAGKPKADISPLVKAAEATAAAHEARKHHGQ